ncbi:hypothetical protein FRC12_008986 [Ceratobasidium sp. 428]|nr:hypothetical protein FRC12_008986 [Ceratobasidium sp. 428]
MNSAQLTDAFTQLEEVQGQLISVVTTFHDACMTLYQAAIKPKDDGASQTCLDFELVQLADRLSPLSVAEHKLRESLAFLCRTRNTSQSIVPINKLPAEILSRVFECVHSQQDCVDNINVDLRLSPLAVLPSVCASWRQVALDTPPLWTHLDFFGENGSYSTSRITLWLQRARHAPLHLHFKRYRFFEDEGLTTETGNMLSRAGSFTFESESSESLFKETLDLYNKNGRSDRLKAITIRTNYWHSEISEHFNWSCFVPSSLTTLKLFHSSNRITPSLDELMTLLSRTTNLRTLIVRAVSIISGQNKSYPEISLPNLEYFASYPTNSTRRDYLGVTKRLLQSIIPGACELEAWIDMGLPADEEHDSAIRKFLERARVTRLHIGYFNHGDELRLARYLDYLPELQVLSMDFNGEQTSNILAALISLDEAQSYRPRCPKLHTLRLSEARIIPQSQDQLKKIVECHDLKRVVLGYGANFINEDGAYNNSLEWIRGHVPNVESSGVSWFEFNV